MNKKVFVRKSKNWIALAVVLLLVGLVLFFYQVESSPPTDIISTVSLSPSMNWSNLDLNFDDAVHINTVGMVSIGAIDQSQENHDTAFYVGTAGTNVVQWYAQTVVNSRLNCNGFGICIARHKTPSDKIYFGVMLLLKNPDNMDNFYYIGYLQPSDLPNADTLYWFNVEIPQYSDDDGKQVIIVAISPDPIDGNYWYWAAGSGNPYPKGYIYYFEFYSQTWKVYPSSEDMCFRTYSPDGGGDIEPVISISYSSWVVTQAMGILSWLGAAFSVTRYFGVL